MTSLHCIKLSSVAVEKSDDILIPKFLSPQPQNLVKSSLCPWCCEISWSCIFLRDFPHHCFGWWAPRIWNTQILGIFLFFSFFWPCCEACGILVPQPGRDRTMSAAVETWSPNHWTVREVPWEFFLIILLLSPLCFSSSLFLAFILLYIRCWSLLPYPLVFLISSSVFHTCLFCLLFERFT